MHNITYKALQHAYLTKPIPYSATIQHSNTASSHSL